MGAGIVVRDEDQGSHDACVAQTRDAFLGENSSDSLPVIGWGHCQVIKQATAAIVPAEHRADEHPVLFRDATKTWITQKVSTYFLFGIALGYLNALYQVPERHRLVIVVNDEFPGADHGRITATLLSYTYTFFGLRRQIHGIRPSPKPDCTFFLERVMQLSRDKSCRPQSE